MTIDEEDCCEKCGKDAPETEEEFEAEGWMFAKDKQLCKKCGLEVLGQLTLL